MAIELYELVNSRQTSLGERSRVIFNYVLLGTGGDDVAAMAHLLANTTEFYGGLARRTPSLGEFDGVHQFASIEYSGSTPLVAGNTEFSFDTTGISWEITHSIQTKESVAAPGKTAPDFSNGINVGNDGPAGVQLPLPGKMNFEEKHYLADSQVTPAYKRNVMDLSFTVNNNYFKGFAAGEVLFKGVRGSKREQNLWELNYFFSWFPNRTNLEIAPGIVLGQVDGFDVWWLYEEQEARDDHLVWTPVAGYVEQVFERTNFAGIGIGT